MMAFKEFKSDMFGALRECTDKSGAIWFSASDAYRALDLDRSAIRRIPTEDKQENMFPTPSNNRRSAGVSLGGLFLLIFASKKKEAVEYKNWVAHVVLPAIYADGGYILGQERLPADDRAALAAEVAYLHDAVEKANAGKKKLSEYLQMTDGIVEQLVDESAKLRSELDVLRSSQAAMIAMLLDEGQVKEYLAKLTAAIELDAVMASRQEEFRKRDEAFAKLEASIPYAKPKAEEPDPMVVMANGLRVPLSEYLAEREAKRG